MPPSATRHSGALAALQWLLQWHGPWVAACLLPVVLLPGLFAGLDWRLALSGWFFATTVLLTAACLTRIWPGRRRLFAGIGAVTAIGWLTGYIANCYVSARHGARMHSRLLIEALANSTPDEQSDYVVHAVFPLSIGLLAAVAVMAATWWLTQRLTLRYVSVAADDARSPSPFRRRLPGIFLAVLAGLLIFIHVHPALRRENPLVFWGMTAQRYATWTEALTHLEDWRRNARARVGEWQPRLTPGIEQNTVVLVLGESVNRWNWQLYGYPRPTTPRLVALREELLVFRDVVASAFSTVPNIERILTTATVEAPHVGWGAPTVPMLAKAAGYKLFWISNQADIYLSRMFAADADERVTLNWGGSRGDTKLDSALLAPFEAALADPAPLKLIIVHTLGAHPHYDLRSEARHKVFDEADDHVQRAMRANRLFFVRWARNAYDAAMLYQDELITSLIASLRSRAGNGRQRLLYVSDHGQEVGHFRNTFGHSQSLESGYVVPMLIWPTGVAREARDAIERRPYQTDKLDWTLLGLLGIATAHDRPEHDILGERFRPSARSIDGSPYVPGPTPD